MDDQQFSRLVEFLNYSWDGYRKVRKGVKKRVARHMSDLGCRNMEEYLEKLEADPVIRAECERRMTVTISRFFRDLRVWEILETRVLPELAEQDRDYVRVWFAGCAGGEEVYSFRILWEEFIGGCKDSSELFLIATDVVPEYLERAKKGVYPKSTLKNTDETRREKWFLQVKKDQYTIWPFLKEGIDWRVHDLLADDPPEKELDIIFLRNNLLTYYQEELVTGPLEKIIGALKPWGFLIIGAKEKMPEAGLKHLIRFDRYVLRRTAKH